jgi:hypothetical protein
VAMWTGAGRLEYSMHFLSTNRDQDVHFFADDEAQYAHFIDFGVDRLPTSPPSSARLRAYTSPARIKSQDRGTPAFNIGSLSRCDMMETGERYVVIKSSAAME